VEFIDVLNTPLYQFIALYQRVGLALPEKGYLRVPRTRFVLVPSPTSHWGGFLAAIIEDSSLATRSFDTAQVCPQVFDLVAQEELIVTS
jgi:hypothetical protein